MAKQNMVKKTMKTDQQWYELRDMVYAGDFDAAEKMLGKNPELLHAKNGMGETALQFLAVENDQEGVAWLFSKGASLNVCNTFGEPALFEVAQLGYKDLFLWFLRHGADPHIRDNDGNNIFDFLNKKHEKEIVVWVGEHIQLL